MTRSSRPLLIAGLGVTAMAVAWVVLRSRSRRRGPGASPDDLHVAALDGVVGQPQRLLAANLPRPRLRRPRSQHRS